MVRFNMKAKLRFSVHFVFKKIHDLPGMVLGMIVSPFEAVIKGQNNIN